jgi:hypothetical protein
MGRGGTLPSVKMSRQGGIRLATKPQRSENWAISNGFRRPASRTDTNWASYALEGWKGESLSKLKATFNFQPAKDEPLCLDKDRICMENHGRKGYGFCAVRWKVGTQLDDRREGEAEAERGPEGECVLPSSSSSGW